LRKISKQILEKINNNIIQKTYLGLLKNSKAAIDCFFIKKNLKKDLNFYKLTKEYYPSISKKKKLVLQSITFAKKFTYITDESVNIILNARETILNHDEGTWSRKSGLFTLGSF